MYNPRPIPKGLPRELEQFLIEELRAISREFSSPQELYRLSETHVTPVKPRTGDVRYSDGTDWALCSGPGLYVYSGTEWEYLGPNLTHQVPASITLTTGGTPVGTVAGVQTWNDGTEYQVPEVTGVPGFDVRFNFTGIESIRYISTNIKYDGSASHDVVLQIYNYTDAAWETLTHIGSADEYNTRFVSLPASDADYISSGSAVLRAYHVTSGNASHDIHFDFISLVC